MSYRSAVTKLQAVVAIVIVIVAVAAGAYYFSSTMAPTTTTMVSSSMMTSSSMVASSATGTIVVDAPAIADTLDPAVAWHAQAYEADQNIYQGLIAYAPNSNQIVPLIAQNFTVSPDGLTYKFWLRQNVVFSNGDPVNAYEFWYSIYRVVIMNQGPAYYVTATGMNVSGVTAAMLNTYNTTNDIPPPSLMSIMENPNLGLTVTGQYSLEFHLPAPFAAFLALATQPQDTVVDPLVVSQHGGVTAGSTNTWMFSDALGTGPFVETDYEPNTQMVLQANPNYWGGANGIQPAPKLAKVIYKLVPDALTRLEDVEGGSAQLAYVDFTLASQLKNASNVYVPKLGPMPVVHWLEFNTYKFPFNNKLIREAVVHAINATALDTLYGGYATPFAGPNPKGVLGYNSTLPSTYSYNITLAKQLLAQAGYPGGTGIPPLQLRFSTDRSPESYVVPLIASELSQIGLTVNTVGSTISDFDTFLGGTSPTSTSYPEMMYVTWFWFPDPWAFGPWLAGPLGIPNPNFGGYNNTLANSLMSQADKTTNQNERALLYEQVAEIVYNDAPCDWIAQYQNALPLGLPVASTNLQGFTYNLQFAQTDASTLYLAS
ncbi:MAG TPA: ABC transporter substrate-binding protein [archaeon]|nr:ABC transporter substrate-binding protein [archaeon]